MVSVFMKKESLSKTMQRYMKWAMAFHIQKMQMVNGKYANDITTFSDHNIRLVQHNNSVQTFLINLSPLLPAML